MMSRAGFIIQDKYCIIGTGIVMKTQVKIHVNERGHLRIASLQDIKEKIDVLLLSRENKAEGRHDPLHKVSLYIIFSAWEEMKQYIVCLRCAWDGCEQDGMSSGVGSDGKREGA